MGVYRCEECECYFCSHEHGCEEHPQKSNELVCEDCFEKLTEEE